MAPLPKRVSTVGVKSGQIWERVCQPASLECKIILGTRAKVYGDTNVWIKPSTA